MSVNKIDLANFFWSSPEIIFPTFKIFNLAKYSEKPFEAKATIMARGISHAKVWSLSINIFLTAGSNSQAVAEEDAATIIERTKHNNITFKWYLICSL